MKDTSYIISFTSVDKNEVDFSICCKSNMFFLTFRQIEAVILYYKKQGIDFNLNISSHKPIIINNVKK